MAQTFFDGYSVNAYRKDGPGQAGPKLGLYSQEDAASSNIGLRMVFDDGRAFRYSYFIAAVTVGKIAAQDWSVTGTGSMTGKFVSSAAAAKDDYGTDDDTIWLKETDTFTTDDAADIYAGGYLHITNWAGEGYQYRIKSNDQGGMVNATATAGMIKLVLHDKLALAQDSETACSITGNPYRNLITATSGTDDFVVGVTARSMTIAYYGWVQTWGVATVLADETHGTIAAGSIATLSDGVAGSAQPISGGYTQGSEIMITADFDFTPIVTEPIIGFFLTTATDTEYVPIYLQLAP